MTDADPDAVHRNHDVYFVPGLQRGLMVLEAIAAAGRPLSVSEIATELSLARSSVFRLVYTLRHMGFLEGTEGTKLFALGPRVLNIGFAFLASRDIIEVARPELELLRDHTGVSSHLAIRDVRDVLFLSCVQTRSGFLSNMNVGTRMPAYATPMGWLLLADMPSREIATMYEGLALAPLTEQTPRSIPELTHRIADAISTGYVVSRGIMEAGGSSVSAPVFDKSGKVVAAIDISGPDSAFEPERLDSFYVPEVVAAAARISARLGYARR
ncbi:MAG: IclR family transcriptional regulator [Proteobacteria bacterium]|nr:IclR family transcriptional regulator [Pseudomonadota bacterium]